MKRKSWGGCLKAGVLFVVLFSGVSLCSGAEGFSTREIAQIWRNNGAFEGEQVFQFGTVDWIGQSVFVEGASPLMSVTSQGRLLARKRALVQAQKKLLYLLYEVRYGLPERVAAIEVEGHVVMGHVDRQGVEKGQYVVEVTLPLARLLKECIVWKARVE